MPNPGGPHGWGNKEKKRRFLAFALASFVCVEANGVPTLPYSVRTQPFNARGKTVVGDLSTVGMAGTAVGLPDSLLGAAVNPAGLAMMMQGGLMLTSQNASDSTVQDFSQSISTTQFLMGFNHYPWGLGFSILTPYRERALYELPGSGVRVFPEVKVQQFNFSAARVFWKNRIALGLSLGIGRGIRSLEFPDGQFANSKSVTLAATGAIGVLVQLPRRWLLGGAFHFGSLYPSEALSRPSPGIDQFYQEIYSAPVTAAGVSWIPNRFFRMALGLYFSGSSREAYLLRSNDALVNLKWLPQVRLGAKYTWLDFSWIQSEVLAGTYVESRTISGDRARVHTTAATKTQVWLFNAGFGVDWAPGYENYIVAFGVDINQMMEFLDLLPRLWRPSRQGWFPNPARLSDDSLPRPLVKHWKNRKTGFDVFKDGPNLPRRLKRSYQKRKKQLGRVTDRVGDTFSFGRSKEKKYKKRKRKK